MFVKDLFATLAILTALLLFSAASATAQHGYRIEKQLKFQTGKSSARVTGRIGNRLEAHEYRFKAKKGQFVEIRLVPKKSDMNFLVMNPNDEQIGEDSPKTIDWEGTLEATGEYRINIHALDRAGSYTLFVSIK